MITRITTAQDHRAGRWRGGAFVLQLALVALLTTGCAEQASEQAETSASVPVTVQPARVGDIQAIVVATGVVTPAPGADLIITAPQPARIVEMPKAEGDTVRRGDLLVRFQIPSLDADIASRRADIAKAEARLQNARAAAARATDLFDRGVAARKDVEDAHRELADAETAGVEADASARATMLLAGRADARARFDGVVAKRWHNPGDLVEAASTDPVLRVIDPRHLEVEASVPASELPNVTRGAVARIVGPSGAPAFKGTVVNRPATVDSSTSAAAVRVALTAASGLASGTPVRVEILGEVHRQVLLVPSSAIVQEGPASFVFVAAADGKAHRRPVTVTLVAGADAEIHSGVAKGDQVITRGQTALPDGASVALEP